MLLERGERAETEKENIKEGAARRRDSQRGVKVKMGAVHFMTQNALLLAAFLLSAVAPSLAVYGGGECTFNTKGTCEYQGQVYGIGESWITKDCYNCVCMEPFGVGCCDHPEPVDYPEWCEIIRKPDSCISVVVMRANHKLPCLYGKWGRLRPDTWKSDNDPIF
ncbi:prostate-associated microseminoprotein isoform X2 [Astyanax mexicanus]|uniref:Prostate-associated microseminoprotein-like n=1 Tax=Astyanax mexicanus TaxID=7994 RepID=A0A8B9KZG8_ASTMX|nr:prostate-associated microseminoprotein isoform X2 [Astyanax mexicanus]